MSSPKQPESGWRKAFAPTPKNLVSFLITLILVVGGIQYGIVGLEMMALTIAACMGTEALLSLFLLGRKLMLQSSYVSSMSLMHLVRPAAGLAWPFMAGAFLSIGSKYVLRWRGRHLWNPTSFGISLLVLLAPAQVALLSHEYGNAMTGTAIIWVVGLIVAYRAKVLHISLAYVTSFIALAGLRTLIVPGTTFGAEVGPLTGPMYQLMTFFMMTDPRTTVSTKVGRIMTVIAVASVECLIRLGNDFDMAWAAPFAPAPAILALFFVGPIALAIDLARTTAPAPKAVPAAA